MTEQIVDYPTQGSDYLPHVIARCVEKSSRHGHAYRFSLNGAVVVVRPGQSAEDVNAEVQRQWQAGRPDSVASSA